MERDSLSVHQEVGTGKVSALFSFFDLWNNWGIFEIRIDEAPFRFLLKQDIFKGNMKDFNNGRNTSFSIVVINYWIKIMNSDEKIKRRNKDLSDLCRSMTMTTKFFFLIIVSCKNGLNLSIHAICYHRTIQKRQKRDGILLIRINNFKWFRKDKTFQVNYTLSAPRWDSNSWQLHPSFRKKLQVSRICSCLNFSPHFFSNK